MKGLVLYLAGSSKPRIHQTLSFVIGSAHVRFRWRDVHHAALSDTFARQLGTTARYEQAGAKVGQRGVLLACRRHQRHVHVLDPEGN